MSLPMTAECLMCHFNRSVKKAMAQGDSEKALAFAKELMGVYQNAPADVSSPWFNPIVAEMLSRYFGLGEDQYIEEKEMSNRFVMERFDTISSIAQSAEDPVLAGLQIGRAHV